MNTQVDSYNPHQTSATAYNYKKSDTHAPFPRHKTGNLQTIKDYEDQEIIELYQKGSLLALTEILNRYEPLLISYANRNHTLPIGREEVLHHLTVIMIEALQTYDLDSGIPLAVFL